MTDLDEAMRALPALVEDNRRLCQRVDLKRRIIELTSEEVKARPYLVWNAFLALLTTIPYENMTEVQRSAYLAFFYDGDVQNGGHYQFFVNQDGKRQHDVAAALVELSLGEHAKLFQTAHARWQSQPRSLPASAEEFVESALEDEFEDIDAAYHEIIPTIVDALESLLGRRQAEFVRVK